MESILDAIAVIGVLLILFAPAIALFAYIAIKSADQALSRAFSPPYTRSEKAAPTARPTLTVGPSRSASTDQRERERDQPRKAA